jgi:hypothetical protein
MTNEERTKVLDALEEMNEAIFEMHGCHIKDLQDAAAIMRKEQEPVSDAEKWKQAVMLAYGHLWHVNNEPMAPIPLRSPEKAAYAARRVLLDLLTHEERGLAINEVRALLEKAR